MLTEQEMTELYDEVLRPYTNEELALHFQNRSLKSELEVEHAYNYESIISALEWLDFIRGNRKAPPPDMLWRTVRPVRGVGNDRCVRFERIFQYFDEYDYQNRPRLPIVVFCSRSGATVFELLQQILDTPNLCNAQEALNELCNLVTNFNKRVSNEEYHAKLKTLPKQFLDSMKAYSFELGNYLRPLVKDYENPPPQPATKKDVDEAADKTRKHINKATSDIKSTVVKATQEFDEGCHHPKKDRDKLVQEVIRYLAKPGVAFSIYNACVRVAGKGDGRSCKTPWLYDWCHDHENAIRTQIDVIRSMSS